jgi:hypothetical protein
MGLYLCVFDGDEELDGVEIGSYGDFAFFRDAVAKHLEGDQYGSRFPTLLMHSDSEGEWPPDQAVVLEKELLLIAKESKSLPPVAWPPGWQEDVARQLGLRPANLYDCFIDIDGEPLIERLVDLTKLSQRSRQPILFQ